MPRSSRTDCRRLAISTVWTAVSRLHHMRPGAAGPSRRRLRKHHARMSERRKTVKRPLAPVRSPDKTSDVNAFLSAVDATIGVARVVFLALAAAATAVCVVDWAVRTRRISPFSGIARFFRSSIDPFLAPIERRIVRSGGIPSNAPWWGLGIVILAGILIIWLLG